MRRQHDFDEISQCCRDCGVRATDVCRIAPRRLASCPGGPDTNIRQISVAISQRRIADVVAGYRPPA